MGALKVIIGSDDYLVDETARKVIGDGVGLEVIDSLNASNADLQLEDIARADASFSTPPFLDPRKVTWWRNVGFLPGGGGKRGASEETKAALEKFAEKLSRLAPTLPENQFFILSGPALLKTSVVAKRLASVGEMVVFSSGKPWEQAREAVRRVHDLAKERGLSFAPDAAERFVARVGNDTRSLVHELDKLRDYLGAESNVISPNDIAAITSQGVGVEPEIWAVTDALGERNLKKALDALHAFDGTNGFEVFMTSVIEKFFRQLVDLKLAATRGRLEAATAGMNPYVVRKNVAFLSHWTLTELRIARFRFLKLREKAVTGFEDVATLIYCDLVRLLGNGGHPVRK